MKTLILSAFAAIIGFTANASGTKEKNVIAFEAASSFEKEFGDVDNVKWSRAMNKMTRADFIQDEEAVTAYFDENGDYVASTHTMTFDQLPRELRSNLNRKLPGVNVLSVFRVTSKDGVDYFIETEKNGVKNVWKGHQFGDFTKYYVKN